MTGQDLVTAVLAAIMSSSPGDTPATEDSSFVLNAINMLISSWNAALKKAMAGEYDVMVARWNAEAQASLYSKYDSSLFTFTPLVGPFYTFEAVSAIASLEAALDLPDGWTRALQFNAAVDVANAFGKSVSQELAALAAQSKAAIFTQAPAAVAQA